MSTSSSPTGRPRDPRIDDAATAAALELLIEAGYSAMSIDLVARRAGINRPAMYRRWPTLAHLVHQALFGTDRRAELVDTGDLAHDVRAAATNMLRSYARPEVQAAMAGMLSDLHDHPDLRAAVIDPLEQQVRDQFAELLRRAEARGAARSVDADVLLDTLIGALFYRAIGRHDVSPSFVDSLVDLLLSGLLPRP